MPERGGEGRFEHDIEERSASNSVPDTPAPPSQDVIDFISALTSIWAAGGPGDQADRAI